MPNIPSTLPNQPSPRKTNVVPAWLVGFVLLASWNFTPAAFAQTVVKQVAAAESQPKVVPFLTMAGRPGVPTVLEGPRHGSLTLGNGQIVYTPVAGHMGRDSFLVVFPSSIGSQTVRYEVRVLPQHVPLLGAFEAGPKTPALYDVYSRSFILCDPPDPHTSPTLNCWRIATKHVPPGNYFPMVWPGDHGLDQLALYDLETGLLHFLELVSGFFEPRDAISLASMAGGWPVLGDWDGSGQTELAMVFNDGRVYVLGPSSWALWPKRLQVPTEDETLWPVAMEKPGLPWHLAYVAPKSGRLEWLSCEPSQTCSSGFLRSLATFDFRRALGGLAMQFLVVEDLSLHLVPHRYSILDPQTIPVKFPDDPIGGGGGG